MLTILDISDNNPPPYDFHAMAANGISGVIIKLTEGTAYRNELFDAAWHDAKAAGLVVGAYHFARSGTNTADAEARHFLASLPVLAAGDILALDTEDPGAYDNQAAWSYQAEWASYWLYAVATQVGYNPILYSYPAFIEACLQDTRLLPYKLWLANPGLPVRTQAPPWLSLILRQYTWTGRVTGLSGDVDMSVFDGDLDALRALGKPVPKPQYPYTTACAMRGDMKSQPSHKSNDAIDEHEKPVVVEQGATLIVTGADTHTDDVWRPVHLPAPSNVHGWMLPKFVKPRT